MTPGEPDESSTADGLLLAIDLGTTLLKVGLFDTRGRAVRLASARYLTYEPSPGQAEQRPEDWYTLLCELARSLWRGDPALSSRVIGLGLSGRGGIGVFLGADDHPLLPCSMSWPRRRLDRTLTKSSREPGRVNGATMGIVSRLLTLREEKPDVFAEVRHILSTKDYVLFRLTGEIATDESSGPVGREWPTEVFAEIGFDASCLPTVLPLAGVGGRLSGRAASDLGLSAGLPVGAGGHDGVCANVGAGMIEPGQAALTLGTTCVVRVAMERPIFATRSFSTFYYHFLDGRWACGGDAILAGRAVEWLGNVLAADLPSEERFSRLEAEAAAVAPGAEGAFFVPFPGGTGAPHALPNYSASFHGLGFAHTRGHLFRAGLEGVAHSLRAIADELEEAAGPIREACVTGGGSRSRLWVQCLADVMERPIGLLEDEASARGAAVLLALGLGIWGTPDEAVREMVRTPDVIEPQGLVTSVYRQSHARFMGLIARD